MNGILPRLQQRIDRSQLARWALDLVSIPSPTGDSRRAAEWYAKILEDCGLDVTLDTQFPASPSVIAWLKGGHPGPTLELGGHLDVIPVEHEPARIVGDTLYGRGAMDMKGPMAAVLEVARVLAPLREHIHGRLLVCAWGLHEAPGGHGQSLAGLLERGIVGDAVLNVEGSATYVAIIGKGMATYDITIERPGEPVHEVQAPGELPHPLLLGLDVAEVLRTWADELRLGQDLPHVGPESLFIGQFESGDFYNRVPTRCRIVGTRRYAPHRGFAEVEAEFAARLDPLLRNPAISVHVDLARIRDGFCVSEDEPIVRALQEGHLLATGDELPTGGFTAVGDVSYFVNEGGVPAVYFGCGLERAHATPEYVALARLERLARVLIATSACFLKM